MTEINIDGLTDEQKKAVQSLIDESVDYALKHYAETAADQLLPLSAYQSGNVVEILSVSHGVWLPGNVSEIGSWGISVDTERGPVTIGTPHRIRRA